MKKTGKRADKKPNKRRRVRIAAALVVCVAVASVALAVFLTQFYEKNDITVTVPWNPGGTADLTARALLEGGGLILDVENIHGANGAAGINTVYDAPHDGRRLLSTNLSSLAVSQLLGFTETGHDDWEIWLAAFATAVIAVAAGSPYQSLSDLLAGARETRLRCANPGEGSIGFVAAHLFADAAGIDVEQLAFSGSGPALGALEEEEADYIAALSTELIAGFRSGELRALAALSDVYAELDGAEVPRAQADVPALENSTPFGEYYGIMIPKGAPEELLVENDYRWNDAAYSAGFHAFAAERGLVPRPADREEGGRMAGRVASLVCWTLYDTGYVNISPEMFDIPRLAD